MDLQDRLADAIEGFLRARQTPMTTLAHFVPAKSEGLSFHSMPGSTVISSYMDGSQQVQIPFELRLKSMDPKKADQMLWALMTFIANVSSSDIISSDGSFVLDDVQEANAPFINDEDENGYYSFVADFNAVVTMKG